MFLTQCAKYRRNLPYLAYCVTTAYCVGDVSESEPSAQVVKLCESLIWNCLLHEDMLETIKIIKINKQIPTQQQQQ